MVANWTSKEFFDEIESRFNETYTQDIPYYEPSFSSVPTPGTAHISVMAPGGGAVAITSTINT